MKKINDLSIFKVIGITGYIFLYLPLIILIIYSFNSSNLLVSWGGFSLKWYQYLFNDPEIFAALFNSIIIAGCSATISVMISLGIAIIMNKNNVKRYVKRYISTVISVQLTIPEIIIALSMLLTFVTIEKILGGIFINDVITIIIAHSVLTIAYTTLIIKARLNHLNYDIFEAASDLGAKTYTIFFTITLPLILPAVINGWILAFILSMDDLVIASFNSGPGATTLPMLIHSRIRLGISPEISALASIMVGSIMISSAIHYILESKKKNNK